MTPEDFDRIDAAIERGMRNESCVAVMPGQLAEVMRLARIGLEVEAGEPQPAAMPQPQE